MKNQNSIVVLGASSNPIRTSYLAAKILVQKDYQATALGNIIGNIDQLTISNTIATITNKNIATISIFLKPERQKAYYDYILASNPKSIIFNPGSENPELMKLAQGKKSNRITHRNHF